jgi:negative regulator of sigma-B (phosphoserine phosphatase)
MHLMSDPGVGPEKRALEWAVAYRLVAGETDCGDKALVISSPPNSLIAVVDGVGHGSAAAYAAELAIDRLREHATDSLPSLIARCHDALQDTRGVAMGLASLGGSHGAMTWLGVGNVQGRLVPRDNTKRGASMMLTAGIAGDRLPRLHPATLKIRRGDLLLLATDGLREGFADSLDPSGPVQDIADRILSEYHRPQDDGLLLVARYLDGAR